MTLMLQNSFGRKPPVVWLMLGFLLPLLQGNFSARTLCAEPISFAEQVAPIFERRCLSCHNEQQRKGSFSLQTAEAVLDSGMIESGNPAESHLIEVITPQNGTAKMPKDADPLSDQEIEILRNWIAEGAKWPEGLVLNESKVTDFDWWSLRRLKQPSIPELNSAWVSTPVDAFILATLQAKGLTPSPVADRRTLIRRLYFDLVGLPPTPEETAAFVGDPDPEAYQKLVDRLLASPHYGERWARHWLDVVKYADTCGYDKDKLRPNAWPYRDYVIRSFNEDKPYARFVQEQVAGDVLFPGEPDGILGLGFIAAGPWDHIGHVEVPEAKLDGKVARNLDRDDMVSNTLNTFCSVTIQCARCHNHKFDPFTQQHYYGLQSLFAAVDRSDRPYDLDPEIEMQKHQLSTQIASWKSELKSIEQEISTAGGDELATLRKKITELEGKQQIQKAPEFGYHSAIAASPDTVKWVEIELPEPADIQQIILHPCHDDYAGIGSGFGFPVRFKIEATSTPASEDQSAWTTVFDQTTEDYTNPGLTPLIVNCNLQQVLRVRLTATRLVERKSDFILALAELELRTFDSNLAPQNNSSTEPPGTNLALSGTVNALDSIEAFPRWSKQNLIDGKWAAPEDPASYVALAEMTLKRDRILKTLETPERVERRSHLQKSVQEAEKQLNSLPEGAMVYAAATHFPTRGSFKATEGKLRDIRILHRGEITQPGETAQPCVLPLSATDDGVLDESLTESERRAELAHWLTREDHPLVWRSIVNRIWQYHFGQGIVATPNDFGRMGIQPTHPELLDWLACQFRDQGQSFKALHRLIVLSSVYQQQSTHDPARAEIDGANQYLWRMNRRRLEAEEIRDSILSVSGVLDQTMGGPGYYLFELEKPEHSPHYEYHKFDPADPKSHRRSIYRFVVRSQPDPWMTTLDCADSSQSTPRRNETLTSLQALTLLNNQFNLVMAEKMTSRIRAQATSLPEQVTLAIQLMTQREPTEVEREELVGYANRFGLNNLCRFLFNLSEFVYLD